ncbi:MAG: IS701 family transposase [Acidobacteriaceae bacterium]|nr:IS701 family transposase [Acidobacteriaceae bacterium]
MAVAAEPSPAGWSVGFEEVVQRIGPRFSRSEPRDRARAYLQGLLSVLDRKNGWQLAEQAGDPSPYGVQHLLGRAAWDADEVRDDLQQYIVEHLGDPNGVLIVDETGFLKKGEGSVGVQRQYSGTAGGIENCQIGVFLAYHTPQGHAFLDRALYLPESWASDLERRQAANVPDAVPFTTKPALARQMIERALERGIPARWVTGDTIYGSDYALRRWLEAQHISYVLSVTSGHSFFVDLCRYTVKEIARSLAKRAWKRKSAGWGTKGRRWYDWALWEVGGVNPGWHYWLLVRRSVESPEELAYYRVFAPEGTSLDQMVAVAGTRWAIEECFEIAKSDCGLDEYEVRSWPGWHRHITLAMLAHAYLVVMRAQSIGKEPKKRAVRRHTRRP